MFVGIAAGITVNWPQGHHTGDEDWIEFKVEMRMIGQIQEFELEEEVMAYLEYVQILLVAKSIQKGEKVPVLLSVICGKTYALLSSPLALGKPNDKSFEELSDVLKKHFEPKPVVIVHRFHFHRHNQAPGETVAD